MENKKFDLSKTASEAGQGMKKFFTKAKDEMVKVIDQNDDGTFDVEDVNAIAEKVGDAAKNTAKQIMMTAEEKNRELERKRLNPIFVEDLNSPEFYLSKLIRVTEMDKRYQESEVCQGAIGYLSNTKDLVVVNIFNNNLDLFGISLYPDNESEIYYVDPIDRNKYIAMEKYFEHLKIMRALELQNLANDLGAKYFRVVHKERKATFSSSKLKGKVNLKYPGSGANSEVERDMSASETTTIEIAAEMNFKGHDPFEPKLHYLQRDEIVNQLIKFRLDKNAKMSRQIYKIELSQSSGIKEKDAVKIDAALKAMKVSGNTTVTNEVQNESRRYFEYEVEF